LSRRNGHMHIGALFHGMGHHIAGWRHPEAAADLCVDFAGYVRLAQAAEAAKLDLIFLDDNSAVREQHPPVLRRVADFTVQFEPLTLLSALAAVTERIGLVATTSTSFNEPYNVARRFASLDHISNGRAGWNLVTSASDVEAQNFNRETHLLHDNRYERAEEFADVVIGLWNSWEEDAFVRNKDTGIYCDPEKMHVLNHAGTYFSVRGPLNVARSPQGRPVICQAGSSGPGRAIAARTADVIFTAQPTLPAAQEFYADITARLVSAGRQPGDAKILPGVLPIVAATEREAREKDDLLQSLVDSDVGLHLLAHMLGDVDLSQYPIDGPLPELPETNAGQTRRVNILALARSENLTIRQLAQRVTGRDHWKVVGTPVQVADQLEERFEAGAADGYILMFTHLPGAFDDFVKLVLPELRRRGRFRSDYEGHTLRDHLGLRIPSTVASKTLHSDGLTPG
jgi:FMN-dependent oxidoreductase (nitrilotriacetate monooxygenase family)